MDYKETQMIKVAWYYYIDKLTQQEIADMLDISRMRVVKLLDMARESGAIQFTIRPNSLANLFNVESAIKSKYNLKDVFVVPSPNNVENTNENIAKAAAMYISDRISKNCLINIGYGDTTSKTLSHLYSIQDEEFSCVSLTGGVNYYLDTRQGYGHAPTTYLIPAPLIASSAEIRNALKNEAAVVEVEKLFAYSKLTVIGIGSMDDNATILKNNILSPNDFLHLKMAGAVGDILCHFFDANGELLKTDFSDRLISPSIDQIRSFDDVIGVAAGTTKVPAILATLKASLIDILVTDENTAKQLFTLED